MAGALTEEQKLRTMKKYEARPERLRGQLAWYLANNRLYNNVEQRSEAGRASYSTTVVLDRTTDRQHDSSGDGLDKATWRHNAPVPAHCYVEVQDEHYEQASTALVRDFSCPDDLKVIRQAINARDVVVFRSSDILSNFDPAFWSLSFCELFPYGREGLNEPRKIKIGLHEFIRYCLRLSTRKHVKHPSFALVGFDVIARHRAIQAISIRAKLAPGVSISAAAVTREELNSHIQYQTERLNALAENRALPTQSDINRHVADLYSSISTGMRSFWGSNDERAEARTNLFAMQLTFREPSLFFTVSPDSSLTFRVANLSGDMETELLDAVHSTLNRQMKFSRGRLGMIATQNPVACAR
ncbi:Helitron helicase-like domain at N-terminus [Phytophthora infestans]|uniref:Helitron helicase-like domain at N-terminus n=1 Tax=Phytophthora infestans TaxID=4787 RepID=A0A8S9USA9_PHYIN|nr:Helitron helicase-like domain at N-terminus [Phytophthora infestans]